MLRLLLNRAWDAVPTLVALFAGLLAASILLIALNADPIQAFSSMAQGAFGTENATAETLVKAIPILFVAIGICVAFRGGVTNIGGEGQMIMGAVAGVTIALQAQPTSGAEMIVLALAAGFIAGAVYAGIAGFLKAYFQVNEILSTIMLNQVAVHLMNYLLNTILLDPTETGVNHIPKTARILEIVELPRLFFSLPGTDITFFDRTRLHYGLVIAIILAVMIYFLLWRTTIGYRIRAVGQNERAARYAGLNVKRQTVFAMLLSGGCAGLAGVVQVLGLQYRLQTDGSPAGFTASAGFNGIVAALFGGLNPIGAIVASVFFGGLLVGAQKMQRDLGVPAALIIAVNGLIVVFVVSSQLFVRYRARQRLKAQMADREPPPITLSQEQSA